MDNKLLFQLHDKVWYSAGNYYAESKINKIIIEEKGITYYTDAPRCFTNKDVGNTIFSSLENASKKIENISVLEMQEQKAEEQIKNNISMFGTLIQNDILELKAGDLIIFSNGDIRMIRENDYYGPNELGIFSYNKNDDVFCCTALLRDYNVHLNHRNINLFNIEKVICPTNPNYDYFTQLFINGNKIPLNIIKNTTFNWNRCDDMEVNSDISPNADNQRYYIYTAYNGDGHNAQYKYIFNKENAQKFVNDRLATDIYNESHLKSYYEIIEKIEIFKEIDIESFQNYEQEDSYEFDR